jgi:hypothetical protein
VGAIPGTRLAAAVGRAVNVLSANTLPGPQDFQALIPPTHRAWVRRVPNENVWIWFRFDDRTLLLVTLTNLPPVPAP